MENFGTIAKEMRQNLKLTLAELSSYTNLSKQYLSNLENNNGNTKVPSLKALPKLTLILSQSVNGIKKLQENHAKKKDVHIEKTLYKTARPEKVFKLLLAASNLQYFENNILFVNNVISEFELGKFIADNKLDNVEIEQINHNYQIWTLSSVMGEALFEKAAYTTAYNIIHYKIKYCFFVPIEDNTRWREGVFRIEKQIKLLKNSSEKLSEYWENENDFEKYLNIYGLTNVAFFNRFRIYHPYSKNARGNFNIGGIEGDEVKFVDMPNSNLQYIVDKLQYIISTDNRGGYTGKERCSIVELGCLTEKKFP